ncbi:division abnormally delayed protein [Teleopsis dalmanni]|uniref:division abnormally delayed protein n=1 Tax=Teleopsis dalmanni TaxID=139649 RepID=UPI0018CF2C18|nr:division abnormally delayed protein [Teleopsis dalmanni]
MVPLSKKLIQQLYAEFMSHLKIGNHNSQNDNSNGNNNNNNNNNNLSSLEDAIHKFFVNLFPVAYHQAVHLNKDNYGELHDDYINCLKHTYDDLQPFDTIPKEIKHNLMQSVQTATIFMNSLIQSANVLSETDELYALYLTDTCQKHLLKMSYCPSCNGLQKTHAKTCYSYCMNVLRGCSAQYAGVLDSPWSNVVDAIDNLVTTHIRSDNGIVTTIKHLDGKLSEAIMRAMENGPELEKKVKKTCGATKLLPSKSTEEKRPAQPYNTKWATPPDAEILQFLSTIDKSKEFFSNIVNNVCEDEDIQRNDHHCWTGERIGDYTQIVMATAMDTQRYNPEVPLEPNSQSTKLNDLVDKLIKIRKNIGSAVPSTTRSYSDIQSDMARHDDEVGSGRMPDDVDDEEYGSMHGSGDGSGDGATSSPYDPTGLTPINSNDIEPRGSASLSSTTSIYCLTSTVIITLVTRFLTSSS